QPQPFRCPVRGQGGGGRGDRRPPVRLAAARRPRPDPPRGLSGSHVDLMRGPRYWQPVDRPHVLVVDDDARIVAARKRARHYEGCSVKVALDGPGALVMAASRPPDLVLLDVMLPGLDGVEVCRRLRAADDVPILMLTARDATADRVRGLDSGADDYVVKPFAYEELMARVRALLRRRSPARRQHLAYGDVEVDAGAREARRQGREV